MRAYSYRYGVAAAVLGLAALPARGATVAEDLAALAGQWSGAEAAVAGRPAGTFDFAVTPVTPAGALVARGRMGSGDGGLISAVDFEVLQSGGQLFAQVGGAPEGAFAVEHAPFGGLLFRRLARGASEDLVSARLEEVGIGRPAADGSRRLKVTRGEALCRDAAGTESVCGAAETRTYVIKKGN